MICISLNQSILRQVKNRLVLELSAITKFPPQLIFSIIGMAFFSVVKIEIPLLEKSVFLTKKLHDVVLLWFSFFEVISTNQKESYQTRAYLELSRIPMIEFFAKTVDGVQPLFLYKRFIIAFRFMFYWVLNTLLLKPERCNIEFINCLF